MGAAKNTRYFPLRNEVRKGPSQHVSGGRDIPICTFLNKRTAWEEVYRGSVILKPAGYDKYLEVANKTKRPGGPPHGSPFHHRCRRRIPNHRSRNVRVAFTRQPACIGSVAGHRRAGEARAAPVHRRNRHTHLRKRQRAAHRNAPHAGRARRCGRTRWSSSGRGRHASLLKLDRPAYLSTETLPPHHRRDGAAGAV